MASASSKRTLDTDYITFRRVFAKLSDNSQIPAHYVLASVGDGRTYWAEPSTLGAFPTFSEFQFDSNSYIGTNTNRTLYINASNGIGFSTGLSSAVTNLQIYGKLFQRIDISGVSSLYAYSNFLVNNTFTVATEGFVSSSTTPSQTTLTIHSLAEVPALSTNIISYQSLKVISSVVAPLDPTPFAGNMIWSKTDPSTFPVFSGYQDFILQTIFTPPTIGFELSSYSARSFLQLSTIVATSYMSTLSSISSLYTQKDIFSTAMISLSTTEYVNYSTNVSTSYGVSNYTQITYNQKFGETLARATIIQLNDQFGILNAGVSTISSFKTPVYVMTSTNKGFIDSYSTPISLSSSTFFDFAAGSIFNFTVNGIFTVSTQLSTLSTSIGSNIQLLSNGLTGKIQAAAISTNSTFSQLDILGYVSSAALQSSVRGAGTLTYLSTPALPSSVANLYTYNLPSSITTPFTSTTKGVFDTFPYISTQTLQSSILSTTSGLVLQTAYSYASTAAIETSIPSTTKGLFDYAGSFNYLSTASLASSFQSTVRGISSFLYPVSTQVISSLTSTLNGMPFVSTLSLQSTVEGLAKLNLITRSNLQSTSVYFESYTRQFESSIVLPTTLNQQQVDMTDLFSGGFDRSNFYFSSVQFETLGGFESVMQNAKYVTIEYTPVLLFPPVATYASNYTPTLSTGVQIKENFQHQTLFRSKVVTPSRIDAYTNTGSSNPFTGKLQMQMDRDTFLTASSNGLSIVHLFENVFSNVNMFVFESNVSLYTPRSNAFFISIYN
jgi:hypothetical protein